MSHFKQVRFAKRRSGAAISELVFACENLENSLKTVDAPKSSEQLAKVNTALDAVWKARRLLADVNFTLTDYLGPEA